jgi:hypothetical protein
MASNKLVNPLDPTFFTADGGQTSDSTQPDVADGALIQGGNNNSQRLVKTVPHADDWVDVNPGTEPKDVYHFIGMAVDVADKIKWSSRDVTVLWADGVPPALRNGYWNEYTGSWTVDPVSTQITFNKQTISAINLKSYQKDYDDIVT